MADRGSDRDNYGDAKASKFRLKSKSKRRSRRHHEDEHEERSHKRRRSHEQTESRESGDLKRRRKHRSSRSTVHDHTYPRNGEYNDPDHRYRESLFDGLGEEGLEYPGSHAPDPDQSFRESLFDALADDEGAAYWEDVYGQPIHVYPNTKQGPDGKLERMSDEEYAEYVRMKMWEKSHQHIVEEREAQEKMRKEGKKRRSQLEEEAAREEEEREKVRRQMKESLKQGEERRKAKEKAASWERYLNSWEVLKERKDSSQVETKVRELIPWPVSSGSYRHVSKDDIEDFFASSSAWQDDPVALLKIERVRWHPDKMQQRFGQHIDSETMKSVTAVFQVIDRLWNERRKT